MAADSLVMMPWFPKDFMASTRHMTLLERGAYRELLDYQWEMGALPADTSRLARLLGLTPREFAGVWEVIAEKFAPHGDGLQNPRLEQHRSKYLNLREQRAASGSRGGSSKALANAKQSSSKALANDPKFATAKSYPPTPTPTPTPTVPSEPLPSVESQGADAPDPKPPPFDESQIPGLDAEAWRAWVTYRKSRRPAIKPESRAAAARELARYGDDQAAVVEQSIAAGYQGLVPLKSKEKSHGTRQPSYRKSAVERVREATECDLREILGAPPSRVVGTG